MFPWPCLCAYVQLEHLCMPPGDVGCGTDGNSRVNTAWWALRGSCRVRGACCGEEAEWPHRWVPCWADGAPRKRRQSRNYTQGVLSHWKSSHHSVPLLWGRSCWVYVQTALPTPHLPPPRRDLPRKDLVYTILPWGGPQGRWLTC